MRLCPAAVLLPALLAAHLAAPPGRADPLPAAAEKVVDYEISVRLEPETQLLTGSERLTWRNPSTDTVSDLWFHLYLNAFANTESTFFRESGGRLRGDRSRKDGWGWIDVTSMKLADGTDLLPTWTFEQPDDDNAEDRTVGRVALPAPVPPGGEVTLDIAFTARLPKVYARTGHAGDFFLVGQWFPKLGVYEPAGTRGRLAGGWNCHQFHAHSEFYADFGRFRVEITVPERFVVGATGRRLAATPNGDGTTTYVHEQADVHDFAWTADPAFVELVRTFSAVDDVPAGEVEAWAARLGRSPDEVRLSDVEIHLLLQPEHLPQAERHFAAARLALRSYGLRYGRYPFPILTIVDPPTEAWGAGGMEYPTFITAGTSWLVQHWPLEGVRLPELVVVHEFGHNYWYGMVASNEFEESWLDEGFTEYSTAVTMAAEWGETATADLPGLRVGALTLNYAGNHLDRRFDRIRTPAWKFSSSGQYGFNSYGRTALVLATLERMLGEETMARVMRTYHERWRFRHPGSRDFYAVASEVAGRDLSFYFDQVVEGSGVFDAAVTELTSRPERAPRGSFVRDGERVQVTETEAAEEDEAAESGGARGYRNRVMLKQLGEVKLPVEVELRYEDDRTERRIWDGAERWLRWDEVGPDRLLEVRIDPERRLPLDANRLNDSRRLESDPRAAALWTARFLFAVQQGLAALGL